MKNPFNVELSPNAIEEIADIIKQNESKTGGSFFVTSQKLMAHLI